MISINQELWVELKPDSNLKEEKVATPSSYVIPIPLKEDHYLLIHGLTGAMDILEKRVYERLFCAPHGRKIGGGSPRTVGGPTTLLPGDRVLVERGYFLSPNAEKEIESQINSRLLEQSKKEPMCFFLAPTNFCAVGCTYCIEAENPKFAAKVALNPERVDLAFDAMKTLMKDYNREEGFILLFGGEPMQPYSYNTVENILRHCRASGLKIFSFTSGLDLKRFAPLLAEYRDVVLGVCITIDGRPEFHDKKRAILRGFKIATDGIDLLLEHKLPTMVRSNVALDTFAEIPWLRNFYKERGWWDNPLCSFELNILTNHGNFEGQDQDCPTHQQTAEFFIELVRQDPDYMRFRFVGLFSYLYHGAETLGLIDFHKEELGLHARVPKMYGCPSTGAFSFTLDANGSIRMCNEQVGSADAGVGRFWPKFSLDTKRVQTWEVRTPDVLDMCKQCNHRFFCGGGCSLRSMREEGIPSEGGQYADLSKGICGTLQADFQGFFSAEATEIINRWAPPALLDGKQQ